MVPLTRDLRNRPFLSLNWGLAGAERFCREERTPARSSKRGVAGVGGLLQGGKDPSEKPKKGSRWGWRASARREEPQREAQNVESLGSAGFCREGRTPARSPKRGVAGVGGLLQGGKDPSEKLKKRSRWGRRASAGKAGPQREAQNVESLGLAGFCREGRTPARSPKRGVAGVGGFLPGGENPSEKTKKRSRWGRRASARRGEPQREA